MYRSCGSIGRTWRDYEPMGALGMVVKRDMDLYLYFRRRTVGCFLTTALCRQLRTPTGRLVVRMEGRLSCPTRGCERIYVECERGFSE